MNDILQPVRDKPEAIYFATAKPLKEKTRLGFGLAQSIDSAVDELQAFDSIQSDKVTEIAKYIKNNPEAEKNLLLLQKEMDALEIIEVADALATIDSPWGELAKALAHEHASEQYVEKMLFPLGAEVFREIRSMTPDPLTRQLMIQSVADDILAHPERVQNARKMLPSPKDEGTIKQSMRRAATELLGGKTDEEYKNIIHTTVLRSRLSAEQPIFDIAATEHALEETRQEADRTTSPFAKQEAAHSLRETQTELDEAKRIRKVIDQALPSVHDETSLMQALDTVQQARYIGTRKEIAPYKTEPWVPEHIRSSARSELEKLSIPREDLYAKVLKKLDAAERRFRAGNSTWGEKRYKDHMKWLADPVAQANRNQRIINIIDLMITITTLVYGVSGGVQRQIEGNYPNGMTIRDYIDYVESQHPWEVAADLATPKPPKHKLNI